MTEQIFKRIVDREGKIPSCEHCGKVLAPGTKVFSKPRRGRKIKMSHPKRYCEECRRLLKIW